MALTLGNASSSFQIPTNARNAQATGVANLVDTGSGTSVLRLRNGTTTLVDFSLNNTAFTGPSTGVLTLDGTPITGTASGGSATVPDNYQIINRNGDVAWAGVVTGSDGITTGQEVELESYTLTWPTHAA